MADDFSLFTSLRYDPGLKEVPAKGLENASYNLKTESPLYMFDYHRDRMLRAATYWNWEGAIKALSGDEALEKLSQLTQSAIEATDAPNRVKIVVEQDGTIKVEKGPTPPVKLANLFPTRLPPPGTKPEEGDPSLEPRWALVVDNVDTEKSEYTHYKTSKRAMYDSARSRANISVKDTKEVVLVNTTDRTIMEGSITSPYFWRNGRWVTPPVPKLFTLGHGSGGQDGTTRRWALEKGVAVEEAVSADSLVDGEECWISNGIRGFIPCVIQLK